MTNEHTKERWLQLYGSLQNWHETINPPDWYQVWNVSCNHAACCTRFNSRKEAWRWVERYCAKHNDRYTVKPIYNEKNV